MATSDLCGPLLAIAMGSGLGFGLVVGIENVQSRNARQFCAENVKTHRLLHITGVSGDVSYCFNNSHLEFISRNESLANYVPTFN